MLSIVLRLTAVAKVYFAVNTCDTCFCMCAVIILDNITKSKDATVSCHGWQPSNNSSEVV